MKLKIVKGYGCNNEQTLVIGSYELCDLVERLYVAREASTCKADALKAIENIVIDFIENNVGII